MSSAHPYGFGIAQEDERTEAIALDIGAEPSGAHVLSVCSAGEMPLCLLALGADSVDAVDIDSGQLHLAWLKRAAVLQLERIPAMRFLGYMPATATERDDALPRVSCELPPDSRRFWGERRQLVQHGVIWAGRFERYVRRLVRLLRPLAGERLDRLLGCVSLQQQRACFADTLDRRWLRAAFELAFDPRVFARRGMDPRALQHRRSGVSLGRQYFEQFRTLCTATPIRENHLLQLMLLGRLLSSEQVPAYLTRRGFAAVRRHVGRLRLRQIDLHQALRCTPAGTYNRFHLSNIADWMNAEDFATTLQLIAERSARPGRLVWRFIHVDRPVPEHLAATLRVDRQLGLQLERRDRFPFYGIVPALVEAAP